MIVINNNKMCVILVTCVCYGQTGLFTPAVAYMFKDLSLSDLPGILTAHP